MVSGREVCAHPGSQPRGLRNSRQDSMGDKPPLSQANTSVLIESPKAPGPTRGWKINGILVLTGGPAKPAGPGGPGSPRSP